MAANEFEASSLTSTRTGLPSSRNVFKTNTGSHVSSEMKEPVKKRSLRITLRYRKKPVDTAEERSIKLRVRDQTSQSESNKDKTSQPIPVLRLGFSNLKDEKPSQEHASLLRRGIGLPENTGFWVDLRVSNEANPTRWERLPVLLDTGAA
jgi:hypothetical protein